MLLGLFVFTTRRKSTLGSIGAEPSKHPDPRIQAKIERRIKISIAVFVAVLALVFILAATGVITINAKLVAQSMTYVLVGVAVIYFLYLFTLGGLNSDEKKRVLVIGVLFVAAAVFLVGIQASSTSKFVCKGFHAERGLWF